MMKKAFGPLGLAFLPIFAICSSERPGQLRLPFRVIGEMSADVVLEKSDVRLTVNGRPAEVISLTLRERSLAQVPDLGRNFILSFHISSVPQEIVDGVSFFVTGLLNAHDTLILLTPLKAYRIPVSVDKAKISMDIVELLGKDTSSYAKERRSAEKYLEKEIDKLMPILSGPSENPASHLAGRSLAPYELAANYTAIQQFLLNFPENFSNFRDRYLLPNIVKHREISKLLGNRHGERWWIHFQYREDSQIVHKANETSRKLDAYIASHETGALARTMSKALSDLEKQLLISDSVPQAAIADTLQKASICYNVVSWGSLRASGHDSFVKEASDLEAPLRGIAGSSGGTTVVTNDPEDGLMVLRDHRDRFYEICFGHDGDIQETKIQVSTAGDPIPLRYKQDFSKDEMEEWIDFDMAKTVEIDDVGLKNRTLHLALRSFRRDPQALFGLLKVRLRLRDGRNTEVYRTENTLRASQERVSIAIPLSEEFRGEFRLSIDVFDLLANMAASYEREIKLD